MGRGARRSLASGSADAARLGLNFGVKFTNTLVVENHGDPLPGREAMYLSGAPLHVLSLTLGLRAARGAGGRAADLFLRRRGRRRTSPTAVACGFVPVTTCTDLLRPGGYAAPRTGRLEALSARAARRAAPATVPDFIRVALGIGGDERRATPRSSITGAPSPEVTSAERYTAAKTGKPPRKIGAAICALRLHQLRQVRPGLPQRRELLHETPPRDDRDTATSWSRRPARAWRSAALSLGGTGSSAHQIANFADVCNECGNCDVFCPEDGGPYIVKPRFFGSLGAYLADAPRPGFFLRRDAAGSISARGRWSGREVELLVSPGGSADFWDGAAELHFDSPDASDPSEARIFAIPAPEAHVVPVGHYHALRALVTGLFAPGAISWVTAMSAETGVEIPALGQRPGQP